MSVTYTHSFESSINENGYYDNQQKVAGRTTLTSAVARLGSNSLSLRTAGRNGNPPDGDNNVASSGSGGERCDLSGNSLVYVQGFEFYLAHSIYLPDAFNLTEAMNVWYTLADLHPIDNVAVQAIFHVDASRWNGHMTLRGFGGTPTTEQYNIDLGLCQKNVWYDFVHHIKLHPTAGIAQTWMQVNGGGYQLVNDFIGPTDYNVGANTNYWKFANYHETFNNESIVIHDRIVEGTTYDDVAIGGAPPADPDPDISGSPNRYDTFNRVDSASSLGTPSDGGSAWEVLSGTWGISTNKAYHSADPDRSVAVLTHTTGNVDITVTIYNAYTSLGLIGRAADDNNFILLSVTPSVMTLYKKVAGTYIPLDSSGTVTIPTGSTVKLRMTNGNLLEGFVGGTSLVSATDSAGAANVKHGINSDDATTGPRFNNFTITDNGPPAPPPIEAGCILGLS